MKEACYVSSEYKMVIRLGELTARRKVRLNDLADKIGFTECRRSFLDKMI